MSITFENYRFLDLTTAVVYFGLNQLKSSSRTLKELAQKISTTIIAIISFVPALIFDIVFSATPRTKQLSLSNQKTPSKNQTYFKIAAISSFKYLQDYYIKRLKEHEPDVFLWSARCVIAKSLCELNQPAAQGPPASLSATSVIRTLYTDLSPEDQSFAISKIMSPERSGEVYPDNIQNFITAVDTRALAMTRQSEFLSSYRKEFPTNAS